MIELVWLNGQVMPLSEARVSVEDRGFQFADGVYEVIRLYGGKAFTMAEHLERLERSCREIALAMPMSMGELAKELGGFIPKAGVDEGMIYLQVTRGVSARNHVFPETRPTLLFYCRELPPIPVPGTAEGVKLISVFGRAMESMLHQVNCAVAERAGEKPGDRGRGG